MNIVFYLGVISLFGAVSAPMDVRAALLASRGIAAFSFQYFGAKGLPQSMDHIQMDYFQTAIDFLQKRPEVLPNGIGIYGSSLGGVIALVAAVKLKGISSIIAVNSPFYCEPSAFWYQSWEQSKRFGGKLNQLKPHKWDGHFITPESPFDPDERIKELLIPFYKKKYIDFLLLHSADDKIYHSLMFAEHARRLFNAAGHKRNQVNVYPGAGHVLETPNVPLYNKGCPLYTSQLIVYGGKAKEQNQAQIKAWKDALCFIYKTVGKMKGKL